MQGLDEFLTLVRNRHSVRDFVPKPIPSELLEECLEAARAAPSGYNLQPTHFVVVTSETGREELFRACLEQRQVREAGAVVVFTGDSRVYAHHHEKVLAMDRDAGTINAGYESLLRRYVPLAFGRGPFAIGRIWKSLAMLLLSRWRPVPSFPAVHMNYWLAKQVSLAAMSFMLAATAAGLATCPMEGFGEFQVRRALGIPRWHRVVLVVAVGYAAAGSAGRTRLPAADLVHRERW